jgi:hypothetical protein
LKRTLLILVGIIALSITATTPAFAEGGQVRGENGIGDVNQWQVMDPPPFQP